MADSRVSPEPPSDLPILNMIASIFPALSRESRRWLLDRLVADHAKLEGEPACGRCGRVQSVCDASYEGGG